MLDYKLTNLFQHSNRVFVSVFSLSLETLVARCIFLVSPSDIHPLAGTNRSLAKNFFLP